MITAAPARTSRARSIAEILLAGVVFAGLYAAATSSLGSLALVRIPYGLTAAGEVGVGVLLALLAVDLRRVLMQVSLAAVAGTVFYGLLLISPAAVAAPYTVRLINTALVQMVPVFFLSLLLGLIGAMIGAFINSTARGIEL